MVRNLSILLVLATILALPFVFRQETGARDWRLGDNHWFLIISDWNMSGFKSSNISSLRNWIH